LKRKAGDIEDGEHLPQAAKKGRKRGNA